MSDYTADNESRANLLARHGHTHSRHGLGGIRTGSGRSRVHFGGCRGVDVTHEYHQGQRNSRNEIYKEGKMPVAVVEPSDSESSQYKSDIRYAALDTELLHAVFTHENIGDKTCCERDHQTTAAPKQATHQDEHRHRVGKEIENAGKKINRQTDHHYPDLVTRFRELARKQHERYYQDVGQHGQKLYLQIGCRREDPVKIAKHRADGQPREVDHQRDRPYRQQSRQCDRAFSGGDFHNR